LVEKKTGLDGNRTLIHSGFLDWCNEGSIFEQDIRGKLPTREPKSIQEFNNQEFRSYRIEDGLPP
jgi:hypothetical protein